VGEGAGASSSALAAGLVAGAEVLSADGPSGAPARLVAQKTVKKKAPGGTPKKGERKGADDAMEKADGDGAMTKEAMPKGKGAGGQAQAADDGSLSFARDIAPILAANCVGCHSGNGNGKARGKLDMTTFAN
jgi:hypothetical protein